MFKKSSKDNLRFEVDQSIRIEELNKDTVIGIANKSTAFALLLKRKIKRHFNEEFRRFGLSKRLGSVLFAAAIVAALQEIHILPSSLVLDVEYPGYDSLIIKILKHFYPDVVVSLKLVGKHSPAHEVAYFTHTGRRFADGVISRKKLDRIIQTTAGELLHLEFTRIRNPHRPVKKKYTKRA